MKFLTIVSLILTAQLASAKKSDAVSGPINDIYCGEMDPFAVGDACVVYTTDENTGAKLGLVYRDYDLSLKHVDDGDDVSVLVGRSFRAKQCSKIKNRNEITVLKDFNSEYFYMNCDVDGFTLGYQPDLYEMTCTEYDRDTENALTKTIALKPEGRIFKDVLDENGNYIGQELAYSMTIYDNSGVFKESTYQGKVLTEDVIWQFSSEDGDKLFHVYLDEMEESRLTIFNNKNKPVHRSDYRCEITSY